MLGTLATLLLAIPAAGSGSSPGYPPAPLQPRTYASDSGTWHLEVGPTSRMGEGPGRYRLTRGGGEIWAGERPFTLFDAVVSETGFTAGVAYTRGFGAGGDAGDLVVVIYSPQGAPILEERHPRHPQMHGSPLPSARGVHVHEDLDRLTVWIRDDDREEWWLYRMSSGRPLGSACPEDSFGPRRRAFACAAMDSVAGTDLTISQWHLLPHGVRFVLLDGGLEPLWTLDAPNDFAGPSVWLRDDWLSHYVREYGCILPAPGPRRFEVRLLRGEARVTFEVKEAGGNPPDIVEVAREALPAPKPPSRSIPSISLRRLEPVSVGGKWTEPTEAYLDGTGRIAVHGARTRTVHVYGPDGAPLFGCQLPRTELEDPFFINYVLGRSDGGLLIRPYGFQRDRFLTFSSRGLWEGWVELGADKVALIPGSSDRWVGFSWGYSDKEARRLAAGGEISSRIDRRPDGLWFYGIEAVDVAPDGRLAVLDGGMSWEYIEGAVALYSAEGEPLRTIPLPLELRPRELAIGSAWLVVSGEDASAVLCSLRDDFVGLVECDLPADTFGLSPDETELWAVESDPPTLHRFALPP